MVVAETLADLVVAHREDVRRYLAQDVVVVHQVVEQVPQIQEQDTVVNHLYVLHELGFVCFSKPAKKCTFRL